MATTWTCACGRRVPLGVATCRCGTPRPVDASPAPDRFSGAEGLSFPRPVAKESQSLPRWMKQLGSILLLAGVYFGSRGCSRWQTSREARNASVEALSEVVGEEHAGSLVDRHHDACFQETYRTGWGRRQSAQFDEEKYVACIVRAIEKDGRAATRGPRAQAPVRARPQGLAPPSPASPTPTPTPTPEPDYGPVTLGDLKVTVFKRTPNVQLVFKFMALGKTEALQRATSCIVDVQCGGQPIPGFSSPSITDCELEVDGVLGRSDMARSWGNTTPVQGDCTLRVAVVRGSRLQSNELVVPLKETPGP